MILIISSGLISVHDVTCYMLCLSCEVSIRYCFSI